MTCSTPCGGASIRLRNRTIVLFGPTIHARNGRPLSALATTTTLNSGLRAPTVLFGPTGRNGIADPP